MSIPTLASLIPAPVAPAVPGGAKDSGPGEDTGPGGRSAEEFASMVAGLVAALLDAPRVLEAPTTDPILGRVSDPSAGLEGADTRPMTATPAGGDLIPGRVSALSAGLEGADTRPKMEAAAAVATLPSLPAGPDSGRAPGVPNAAESPDAQAEARITVASPASAAAPLSGPAHPGTTGAAPSGGAVGTHSGGAAGVSKPADTPNTQPESGTGPPGNAVLQPTPATAAPTATAPAEAPAPAPAPAATAAQLVAPVVSVHRRGPDGSHTITVDITPDELGPVRVEVELRDGTVELRLAGHSEAARDALRAALPELRRALEAAGVGTGAFAVSPDAGQPQNSSANQPQFGQPQSGGHPSNGHARPAWAGPDGRAPHQPEAEPAPVAGSAGSLDLQL